jgi:hypothetical protein
MIDRLLVEKPTLYKSEFGLKTVTVKEIAQQQLPELNGDDQVPKLSYDLIHGYSVSNPGEEGGRGDITDPLLLDIYNTIPAW